MISSQSLFNDLYNLVSKKSDWHNKSNEYCVSLASFNAIATYLIKSLLLAAFSDSRFNAPMDVPLLKICFDRIYSACLDLRYSYNFTILKANAKVFSFKRFVFLLSANFQFSITFSNPHIAGCIPLRRLSTNGQCP